MTFPFPKVEMLSRGKRNAVLNEKLSIGGRQQLVKLSKS